MKETFCVAGWRGRRAGIKHLSNESRQPCSMAPCGPFASKMIRSRAARAARPPGNLRLSLGGRDSAASANRIGERALTPPRMPPMIAPTLDLPIWPLAKQPCSRGLRPGGRRDARDVDRYLIDASEEHPCARAAGLVTDAPRHAYRPAGRSRDRPRAARRGVDSNRSYTVAVAELSYGVSEHQFVPTETSIRVPRRKDWSLSM